MTYATSTPPRKILGGGIDGTEAGGIWAYTSADAAATVAGAGYFTNGGQLGMAVNDLIFVIDTATPLITAHRVKTVSASGAGATTVSSGTTVGAT